MARPSTPSSLWINGSAESVDKATKNTDGTVSVSAICDDPDAGQQVRLMVRYSTDNKFSRYYTVYSNFGAQGSRRGTIMTRLNKNTKYYVRAWTQSKNMTLSENYNSTTFWTDRYPSPPNVVQPSDNVTFLPNTAIVFDWQHVDADGGGPTGWSIGYRVAATPVSPAGPWTTVGKSDVVGTSKSFNAGTFKPSTTYEWRVRTRDDVNQWGEWTPLRTFQILGNTRTPLLVAPASDYVILTESAYTFKWQFRDPDPSATQATADLRYRAVGSDVWIEVFTAATTDQFWVANPDTFAPGYRYEWQVRTTRNSGLEPVSDWSTSGYFWTSITPGTAVDNPILIGEGVQGELGLGAHRVFIFDQGGEVPRGEITPIVSIRWGRKRDDISTANVVVSGFEQDCGELLGSLRSWRHEIVIFRNEERVWEGPITHLTYRPDEVVIGAHDVMQYVYRRVLRQGYNDSYRVVNGVQLGLLTVVERAQRIVMNSLGYYDPNVLPYLTTINTGNDARQARIVPDHTKTAWEEIDDLAANAGLDYTVVGRRIVFWDTHQHVGLLPEMREEHFLDPPVVTEYGMNLANYFAVTDGQGGWGASYPPGKNSSNWADYYGPVEQLASGYGDTTVDLTTANSAAYAAHIDALRAQAARNINGRYPTPLVARVPDNSTITPDTPIQINQLIPGVWIPLRVNNTVRKFGQVQKLDSVTVEQDAAGERVQVVMSPAPAEWADPDAAATDPNDVEG